MRLRGYIGKLVVCAVAALASVFSAVAVLAGPVTWNQQSINNGTFDINSAANWTGGFPANGSNAFIVWTGGSNNRQQTLTNAASDVFVADSLSITNAAGGNGRDATITFSGVAFFTNGVGQLNFGGITTGSGNLSVQFSSNITFKTITMTGGAGSGNGTLTLAGAAQGGNIVFDGGTGNSFLNINGTLGLTGTLTATNINASSAGTIAGNTTVAGLILNNTANNRFTISGSTVVTGTTASVGGGFTIASTGTLSLGGTGGLILSNIAPLISGTLNVSNQTLNAKTNWANSGTVVLAGGFVVGNNLTNNAGATVLGFGTLSNLLVNSGTLTVTNGTLNVTTAPVQNGFLNLESLATLDVVPAWSNTGTVNLRGGVLAGGNVTNAASGTMGGFGTLSNLVQNLGVLTASNGTLTVTGLPVQNGTAGAANNGILNYLQDWTNSGTLTNAPTGTVTGGTITNAAAGTIKGGGFINPLLVNQGRMDFGGTVSNNFIQTAGSFTLSGNATITGGVTVNGGTVNFLGNRFTSAQIVVGPGGTLTNSVTGATISGGVTNAGVVGFLNDTYVLGPVTNTGTWFERGAISNEVINSGTFSLFKNSINPLVTGGIVNSGSLIFDNNNSPTVNGSITNSGSVAFNAVVNGDYVQTAGSLVINQSAGNAMVKGTASISGGTFDLAGKVYSNGLMVISGTGVLTNGVAGATFNGGLSNANVVAVTANTFFNGPITNTGSFIWQGAVSNSFVSSGTVVLNGAATITGGATVNGGLFDLNGQSYSNNFMVLTGSGVLTSSVAGASFNGGLSNAATVAVTSGVFFKGIITNTGAIFFNGGSLSNNLVSSGTVTLNNTATVTGNTVINGGTLNLNGQRMTNALLLVSGTGVVTNNIAGATVNGGVSNAAVIALTADTFFNGPFTNTGALFFQGAMSNTFVNSGNGTVTLNNTGTFTQALTINSGTLNLNGGRLVNLTGLIVAGNGTVTNAIAGASIFDGLSNNATVAFTADTFLNGVVTNNGAFFFQGAISNNFVNSGAGLFTLNNNATITVAPVNNGTFNLANGTLNVMPAWANAGTVLLGGGTLSGGNVTNNNTVLGSGTVNSLLVNAASLFATNGTLAANGGITNTATGQIFLRNTGTLAGGTIINVGTIATLSGGNIDSAIINTSSGDIEGTNGTFRLGGKLTNLGSISISGGATWNAVGGITNAAGANILLRNTGTLNGSTITNLGMIAAVAGGNVGAQVINLGGGTILATNGALNLTGGLVNQSLLQIGNGLVNNATAVVGSASSGLFDNSGGLVQFQSNTEGLSNAAVLVVQDGFLSSSSSVMSNYDNSASILNFTANKIVTNNGTMSFRFDISAGSLIDTNLMVIVGGGSNTFYNNGTFIAAQTDKSNPGNPSSFPTASLVVSGQFVNAGSMIITNTGNHKSRDVYFTVTGGTVTNEATGSMLFVVNGQPATINGIVQNGGFVNAGSLTFDDNPSTTTNLTLTLSQPGATFSNAPGGQVILLSGNQGTATINADNVVNAGTNLLQSGALLIDSRTGGVGFMVNSGTILFSGGGLNVDFLTNAASGVYKMTVAGQTVNNANTIANFGTINTDSGTLQNSGTLDLRGGFLTGLLNNSGTGILSVTNGTTTILSGGILNSGNINLQSAGTLTGGAVTNQSGATIAAVAGGNLGASIVNLVGGTIRATNQTLSVLSNLVNNGTVIVAAGKLSVAPAWVNSGTLTLSSGGTLAGGNLTNNVTVFGSGTISNLLVNAGAVTVTNGTLTVTTAPINTGSITVADGVAPGIFNVVPAWANGGFVSVVSGGNTIGGTLTNLTSGTVTNLGVINTFVVNQGRAVLGGVISNNFLQTSGTNSISGSGTITGTATISGGLFNLNGGTYTNGLMVVNGAGVLTNGIAGASFSGGLSNNATVFLSANTFFKGAVTNTGSFFFQGAISNNFVNSGAGAVTLNNNATITGIATVSGGTFDLNGQRYTNGLMIVSGTGALTDAVAGATFNGGLSNAATVDVTANTFFNGVITNTGIFLWQGAISNAFVNSGTVALNNNGTFAGTLNNQSSGLVVVTNGTLRVLTAPTQNGTIDITLNNTLSATPAWANGGLLRFSGGFLTGGNTTNNATATILGAGTASNLLVNLGTLIATNGTFNLVNAPLQNGTFNVAGLGTLNVAAAWNNAGAVNMLNGTLIGSTLTNAGSISGSGTITAPVVNNSGATITASGGGTLTLTAIPLQNGIVNILGTLNVASAWSNGNAGTVTINGGVLTGATFTVDGTVKGNGTIAANMVISNAKTVIVNGGQMNLTALTTMDGGVINGGPVINYGTVSGDGTISAALSNPGYVRATNGLLYIQALTGNQATGTLEASTGGTLQANGITPWLNNGRVILTGGTVIGGDISNNTSRSISGFGTIVANVYNSGQVFANNGSQALALNNSLINLSSGVVTASTGNIVVNGVFTNAGTLTMIHSIGTFNGTVVNSGAWVTDPTTNVFQNTYTLTSSGFIQSSSGDVYIFTNNATTASSFINLSTNKAQNSTLNGDFVFANTLGMTQVFATAGHDFGPVTETATNQIEMLNPDPFSLPQYSNNFALGTLEISSYTTVRVDDAFITGGPGTNDDLGAALYLNNLFMGTDSLLLISSNVQVYFITSNNWSLANIRLDGNPNYDQLFNGIHQLVIVPEPAIILLWVSSIVTVYAARRRNARSPKV